MNEPFIEELRGQVVLITGGMGFIGSHLACRLLDAGAQVTVVDINVSATRRSLLRSRRPGEALELLELDICDRESVDTLFATRHFDTVFHLAAYSVIERSTQFPYDSLLTNAIGTLHILEAVRRSDRLPRRVVLTSTDKVYGEMEGSCYLEDSPLRGIGLYDSGKLAADVVARSYFHTFGVPICVIRLCNVFGPHDYNSGYRLFPKSLSRIFDGEKPLAPVLYYESIGHSRDYVHIDDVVDALITVATHDAALGEVFNMASATHIATPVLLKSLIEASIRAFEPIDPLRARAVERNGILIATDLQSALTIERQHLDSTKISTVLGFVPRVSFEDGLRRTVDHYAGRLAHVN